MGVQEQLDAIEKFWGPIESDVDDEGFVIPRVEHEDDEPIGVETRYVRIRDTGIEQCKEFRVPYVRLIGDLDDGDVEMRIPVENLRKMLAAVEEFEAKFAGNPGERTA